MYYRLLYHYMFLIFPLFYHNYWDWGQESPFVPKQISTEEQW